MDAQQALKFGDVRQTLDLLKSEVRRAPRDARLRTFLFQMFCITGEWDRALTQLSVAGELDAANQPMVQTYELAIRCEMLRQDVFAGRRSPIVLGDPGEWLPLLIEAARLLGAGEPERAAMLRDQAFEAAPECAGSLNGVPCPWIADADPRLGPVLEAIVNGKYVWVAYARIAALELDPPQDVRDLVWMPARFTWENGGDAVGLIPTRYPGTLASDDPALLLARRTEWLEHGTWSVPIGQRLLIGEEQEVALLDLRQMTLAPVSAELPS